MSDFVSLGDIFGQPLTDEVPGSPFLGLEPSDVVAKCESPLESRFALSLIRRLHPNAHLESQVSVDTICGRFRLDFVVTRRGRMVAVECDGKDYHDEGRDEWRDAMVLGAEAVDVIYRFRGSDLTYHLNDCLFLISQWEPDLVSPAGFLPALRLRLLFFDIPSEARRKFGLSKPCSHIPT